jgi:hypothetical protein
MIFTRKDKQAQTPCQYKQPRGAAGGVGNLGRNTSVTVFFLQKKFFTDLLHPLGSPMKGKFAKAFGKNFSL